MLYGHRKDVEGFARSLEEFDAWLGPFLASLKVPDLLLITADHGCDPRPGLAYHGSFTRVRSNYCLQHVVLVPGAI